MQLGVVYAKKEAFDDAFFHLYQAQWMAQTHGHQETMRQTANQIYLLHKKNNQLDSALFYHELLLFTSNTIWDTEKTRQINSLQLSFNLEERLQQLEVKEKQIQQQNYLTWLLIIFIVSLGFFIGKLYFQQKKLNHQNKVLRLQNTQILTQSEQMAQMNSLKDKLFSIISHDLRSPLKNLQGAIELLNTENALNHEEILAITSSIQQQTENVSVVMENLLQWSLAQMKGQQQWQPISLNLLAATQEAINLLQNIADNKNITIFCSIDPMLEVIADENHLKFIMRNLLGNAIKFTANGGRVLLYSKIENNDIVVKVEDTGVGMTPAQCTKLFNINTHFSTTGTQAEKGTGLGLLLVKDFVEQNGGNISVESEAGKGTIFSFTVKRAVK
jgi:signal transduction histidine kinase